MSNMFENTSSKLLKHRKITIDDLRWEMSRLFYYQLKVMWIQIVLGFFFFNFEGFKNTSHQRSSVVKWIRWLSNGNMIRKQKKMSKKNIKNYHQFGGETTEKRIHTHIYTNISRPVVCLRHTKWMYSMNK